jgi:hypothetical protein
MRVREFGRLRLVNSLQPENAFSPMVTIVLENVSDPFKPMHSLNALSAIEVM